MVTTIGSRTGELLSAIEVKGRELTAAFGDRTGEIASSFDQAAGEFVERITSTAGELTVTVQGRTRELASSFDLATEEFAEHIAAKAAMAATKMDEASRNVMGRIDLVGQNLQSQTAAAVSRLVATSDDARRTVMSSVEMAIDKARANFVERLRELAREFTEEMTAANLKALDSMAENINALSSRIHDDLRSLETTANKSFSMMLEAQAAMTGHVEASRSMLTAELQNQVVQIEQQMARVVAESVEKLQAVSRSEEALVEEDAIAELASENGKARARRPGQAAS